MDQKITITVESIIRAPIEKVWKFWTKPDHIVHWTFASDDWEAPAAENDIRVGGKFKTVMAAKNKSTSFDFTGKYTNVIENELIEYDLDDGRHVKVELPGFQMVSDSPKHSSQKRKIRKRCNERVGKLFSITLQNTSKRSKYAYAKKAIQNNR
jgi:uncharacterized protein YndB with AHSA1/START domain